MKTIRLARVAAIHEVVDRTGILDSQLASPGEREARAASVVILKNRSTSLDPGQKRSLERAAMLGYRPVASRDGRSAIRSSSAKPRMRTVPSPISEERLDDGAVETEVRSPSISAWVEEASQGASAAGESAEVGTFATIADGIRESQIPGIGDSSMLTADNVIHLECEEAVVLVEQAIFAEEVRSFGHEPARLFTNGAAHWRGAGERGLWPIA